MPRFTRSNLLAVLLAVSMAPGFGCSSDPAGPPPPEQTVPTVTIDDLAVIGFDATSVTVGWTVPDDRTKAAETYDLRFTTDPNADWADWTVVPELPAPGEAGARESVTISGLTTGLDIFIRLRVGSGDDVWSVLSNELVATPHEIIGRTIRVRADGSGDAPTLQDAVEMAVAGDLILVAPGHYRWSEQVDLADSWHVDHGMILLERDYQGVEIRSEGGPRVTILDAEGQGRLVFAVGYNDQCVIDGFTIINGVANESSNWFGGGGIIGHLSPPTIRNCVLRDNTAFGDGVVPGAGGGMWWGGVSAVRIEACIFENNQSDWGGGLFMINSYDSAVVSRCVFRDNSATTAGGGLAIFNFDASVDHCVVVGNTSDGSGGGVWIGGGVPGTASDTVSLDHCTIVGNSSPDGSGLRVRDVDDFRIRTSIIAFGSGGAAISWNGIGMFGLGCSNIYGNPHDSPPPGTTDFGGMIHLDPLFCDWPDGGVPDGLFLEADSPCRTATCGSIGALTAGCGG